MIKYEYTTDFVHNHATSIFYYQEDINNGLSQRGSDGWRLIRIEALPDKPYTMLYWERELEQAETLEELYRQYIALLAEELESSVSLAAAHGWQSSKERIERGEQLRIKIRELGGTI